MTTPPSQEAALPRSEITVSLVLAVVTAIGGLLLAFHVAPPGNRSRLRLPALDRSLAESGHTSSSSGGGEQVPVSAREAPSYVPFSPDGPTVSFGPPMFGMRAPESPSPRSSPRPSVTVASPRPAAPATSTPAPPAPPAAPAVAGSVPSVQSPNGGVTQPSRGGGHAAARLTARTSSLPQAWQAIGSAVGIVRTHDADYLGVAVAPDGLFVTSRAAVERPEVTVHFSRGPVRARVVAVNHRFDLVVLRLAEPPPAMVALSSSGSLGRGTPLAYAVTAEVVERHAVARVVGMVGDAADVYHYNGVTHETTRGTPMVNASGDLVGIVVGRAWSLPGGAFSLAASPSSLKKLVADATAAIEANRPPPQVRRDPHPSPELQSLGHSLLLSYVTSPHVDRNAPALTIVPAVRIGPLYLGMSMEEASKGLVQDGTEPLGSSLVLHQYNDHKLSLVGAGGKVVAAGTQDPHYGSVIGVGAGMMLEHLPMERVVPNLTVVHDPLTGDKVATGEGLEVVADSSGRIREVRVLPVPAP